LVTVEPANTEKLAADPRPTLAVAPIALLAKSRPESNPSKKSAPRIAPPSTQRRTLGIPLVELSFKNDAYSGGGQPFTGVS
jgi:hypothetical protein